MEIPLPLLLDGATGTNLFAAGMPQGICVEQWILENPSVLKNLQSAFIAAGSDVLYAPTFSANRVKLAHFGLEEQVQAYNTQLVLLSKEAANGKLVAGNLSPTGLFVEPFGDTTFSELVTVYKEQATALDQAGVDLFVIETMMSLTEARAAVFACRGFHKPILTTITVNEHGRTLTGATPLSCLITLQELGISAFGINCSCGPDQVLPFLEEMMPYRKIPIIAKPNAGQPNPLIPNQYDLSPVKMAQSIAGLLDLGVSIVGGCCGTTPDHIAQIRQLLDQHKIPAPATIYQTDEDAAHMIYLSNESSFYALDSRRIEFSEPIDCQIDMADSLLDAEDESFDVIVIHIDTPEDAKNFALNAHLCALPICFQSDDPIALKAALRLYQGRSIIDRTSQIEPEELQKIACKYGAVLY